MVVIRQIVGLAQTYRQSDRFRAAKVRNLAAYHSAQGAGDHFSYFIKALCPVAERQTVRLLAHPQTGQPEIGRPEPELAVLLGEHHRPHAICLANDFTLGSELAGRWRDDTGQWFDGTWWGKSREGLAILGPAWRAIDSAFDWTSVTITMVIFRARHRLFSRTFPVADWKWKPAEAAERVVSLSASFGQDPPPSKRIAVTAANELPAGTVLMMGTNIIVPAYAYSQAGDEIQISAPPIGTLVTNVI